MAKSFKIKVPLAPRKPSIAAAKSDAMRQARRLAKGKAPKRSSY